MLEDKLFIDLLALRQQHDLNDQIDERTDQIADWTHGKRIKKQYNKRPITA